MTELTREQIELVFRGYNIHLSFNKKEDIVETILEYARPVIQEQYKSRLFMILKKEGIIR